MVTIYDKETGVLLGQVSDEEFQFVVDQLEEESSDDDDYYFNETTLDNFDRLNAPKHLMQLLRKGIGEREDFEIRFVRDAAD